MKILLTNGTQTEEIYRVKSINPMTDERPGVWTTESVDTKKAALSNRLVPSVYAGISSRIQAMADLPFTIYSVNGDKELDSSDNYKNVVGFLPYPSRTFALTEASLTTSGRAYWFKGTGSRTGKVKELKYWIPSSVTLDSDAAKKGEVKFRRQGVSDLFAGEQVLHTWLIDPDVELGPPLVWPLESAIVAAEANGAISKWVADYMRRGAIKAMLLMVEGMPPETEANKMEAWFNKFMSGARGLTWKIFNATGVKPTIVGDGLEALRDLSITKELRYEIHQALGTRHLLEDENLATANARERQFYTITIVPDARAIQYSWNEQVLHPMGYHLEFEPERLEIFQEDEGAQAQVFLDMVKGLSEYMTVEAAFQIASEKLDYIFSDKQMAIIKKGVLDKQAKKPDSTQPVEVVEPTPPEVVKAIVELDRWEAKVKAAGKMVTWHAVNISPELVKEIKSGSVTFEQARAMINPVTVTPAMEYKSDILTLAEAINKAVG